MCISLDYRFSFEPEVFARDAAQDHAFHAVEVVEAVAGGFADGRKKGIARIFAHHAQQLAQGKRE